MQGDLAADPPSLEQLLEQLVAAALGMHYRVLDFEKRLERQALGVPRVAGTHQASKAMGEKPLLEEVVLH